MFTGIIEAIGRVASVEDLGGGRRLTVAADFASELHVDQSISVNGACQTVVATTERTFDVVAVEETLRKTTLGGFAPGTRVNLERAMRPDTRLDGHLVQGHVDATGLVTTVVEETTSWLYTFRFDPQFARYVIPVGSIAIDGISLTVARLSGDELTVAIIPHTFTHTIVPDWREGGRVNLEFDLIGKYVARSMDAFRAQLPSSTE